MKKKLLIAINVIVLITYILLIILFDSGLIKEKACNSTSICFLQYHNKKYLIDENTKEIITTRLGDYKLFEDKNIELNKNATIDININDRHKRILGSIKLEGKYDSEEKLKDMIEIIGMNFYEKRGIYQIFLSNEDYIGNSSIVINDGKTFTITINVNLNNSSSNDLYVLFSKINSNNVNLNNIKIIKYIIYYILGCTIINVLIYNKTKKTSN